MKRGKLQRLFEWKHIRTGVFTASVLEATVVPIPLEILLIPAMVARRDRLWGMALTALFGSFVGAALWYLLGYSFHDGFGTQLMAWLGHESQLDEYQSKVESQGFWIVLAGGITPTPFQVVCFLAGAVQHSLPSFAFACVLSRGIRYFALAGLVRLVGEQAECWWKEHKVAVAVAGFALFGAMYGVGQALQSLLPA